MKYETLPFLPRPVSRIALGTALFGSDIPEDEAFAIMDAYAECGGNVLDSAHMYANWLPDGAGKSETTIGRWLRQAKPEPMLIATKGAEKCMTRDGIRRQLQESLGRLGLDKIDFYWLHRDNRNVPAGEILEWLNELVGEGWFPAFGCSNWRVPRIAEAREYAAAHHLQGFSASQIGFSLAVANPEITELIDQVFMDRETLDFHRREDFPVVAYTSQAGGFFSGKYTPDGPATGCSPNPNTVRLFHTHDNCARLAACHRLAAEKGCSPNQICLAWLLHQPFATVAIVGANRVERVNDSCGAADISLSAADMGRLS